MNNIPPTCKVLTPFIKRADELKDSSENGAIIAAYYCRLHAITLGVKLQDRGPDGDKFLAILLSKLEDDKKNLKLPEKNEAKDICTNFAMKKFAAAFDQDMAGESDKDTARQFFAAGTFFDTLSEFGDLSPECTTKKKYAKLKAVDILNAIKEGRTPTPGLPGQMSELDWAVVPEPSASISQQVLDSDMPSSKAVLPSLRPEPKSDSSKMSPMASARTAKQEKIEDAAEYLRFALRALEFNDRKLAKQRLQTALQQLN